MHGYLKRSPLANPSMRFLAATIDSPLAFAYNVEFYFRTLSTFSSRDSAPTLFSYTASNAECLLALTDLASTSEAAVSNVRASIACCLPDVSASAVLERCLVCFYTLNITMNSNLFWGIAIYFGGWGVGCT